MLARVWGAANALHDAGIGHGRLDARHLRVDGEDVVVDGFSSVDMSANAFWLDRDRVTVLVTTMRIVGADRAIAAARQALGDDALGALIPMVQPVSLPPGAFRDVDHLAKQLKELRAALVTATGVEDVAPLKIRRLGLANVGMLIGVLIALAICIPSLENIDFASVKSEFEHAQWAWGRVHSAPLPVDPPGLGHRADGGGERGAPARADRPHPARRHLPEPRDPERHRWDRAPDRLSPPARRPGRLGHEPRTR